MTFVEWFEWKYDEGWISYSHKYANENGVLNFGARYRKLEQEYLLFCEENDYEEVLDG